MMSNLTLPLCPKCGDTRFVNEADLPHYFCSKLELSPYWKCSECKIKWKNNAIYDKDWNLLWGTSGELVRRKMVKASP